MTDGCPGIITIAIVRLNDTWFASVTVTPKLNRPNPVVVGIPLISPLRRIERKSGRERTVQIEVVRGSSAGNADVRKVQDIQHRVRQDTGCDV